MDFKLCGMRADGYTFGARRQIVTGESALTALVQFSMRIER
jgi:hypothetical protein